MGLTKDLYVANMLFLERVLVSLFISLMILLHLFVLSSMCWLKSSLQSKISPRCLYTGADHILLIKSQGLMENKSLFHRFGIK